MKYAWRNLERYRNIYLNMLKNGSAVVVFDVETTGVGPDDRVIQFAAIRYRVFRNGMSFSFQKEDSFDVLINPGMDIPKKIEKLTGIRNEDLKICLPEGKQWWKIQAFLSSGDIWAAYNKDFDIKMLRAMAVRCGQSLKQQGCIDVLTMARDCVLGNEVENHKLGTVAGYMFPGDSFIFHDAYDDVRATAMLLEEFMYTYASYQKPSDKVPVELKWASYNISPYNHKLVRIKMNLSSGEYGDIFFDVPKRVWSCVSKPRAERLFRRIDLVDMENQLMRKYAWKYHAEDIDQLASAWGKEKREKEKEDAKKAGQAV